LYTGAAVGNLLGPVLAGAVFDATGHYQTVMAVCALFSLTAVVSTYFMLRHGHAQY
jgi:cyanate permease